MSFSNVCSLRTNFDEVSRFLQTRSPDLLALSETELDAGVSSADFSTGEYTLHRMDKSPCHGLVVFAKNSLSLRRLKDSEDPRYEYLTFVAPLQSSTFILFFLYRSPSSNCELLNVVSDKIDGLL